MKTASPTTVRKSASSKRRAPIRSIIYGYENAGGGVILDQAMESGFFKQYVGGDGMAGDALVKNHKSIDGMILTKAAPAAGPAFDAFAAIVNAAGLAPDATYAATSFDATFLLALAIEKNGIGRPSGRLRRAARSRQRPGEVILPGEWTKAVELIKAGTDIDYQGASGDVEFDARGDVPGAIEWFLIDRRRPGQPGSGRVVVRSNRGGTTSPRSARNKREGPERSGPFSFRRSRRQLATQRWARMLQKVPGGQPCQADGGLGWRLVAGQREMRRVVGRRRRIGIVLAMPPAMAAALRPRMARKARPAAASRTVRRGVGLRRRIILLLRIVVDDRRQVARRHLGQVTRRYPAVGTVVIDHAPAAALAFGDVDHLALIEPVENGEPGAGARPAR